MPRCNWWQPRGRARPRHHRRRHRRRRFRRQERGIFAEEGGLPHEIHHFTWTHGTGKLLRICRTRKHILKKADELAAFIKAYRDKHPHRPIYVIGKAGHRHRPLWRCRALPAQCVDRVFCSAPAVSPTFDLRAALRATRRNRLVPFRATIAWCSAWAPASSARSIAITATAPRMVGSTIPEQLTPGRHASSTCGWCRSRTRRACCAKAPARQAISRRSLPSVRRRRSGAVAALN